MTNFRYVGMSKPTSSLDTRGEFLEKRWGLLLKIIGKEQNCFYRIKGPELKASETKVENLRLYFGETHNSWEDICCGRARFLVIIGLAGKNNPIGNVFSGLLLHYRAIQVLLVSAKRPRVMEVNMEKKIGRKKCLYNRRIFCFLSAFFDVDLGFIYFLVIYFRVLRIFMTPLLFKHIKYIHIKTESVHIMKLGGGSSLRIRE